MHHCHQLVATQQPSPAPVSGVQTLWSIIGGRRLSAAENVSRTKTPRQPDFAAIQQPLVWLEEHSLSQTVLLRLPKESLQYSLDANASLIDQFVVRHLKSSIPPAQRLGELLERHLQVLDQIFFYGNLTRPARRRPLSPSATFSSSGGGANMKLQWRGSSREKGGDHGLQPRPPLRPLVLLRVEDRFDEHNLITYYDGARRTIHMSASAGRTQAPRRRDELLGLLVYHVVRAYLDAFSSPAAGHGQGGGRGSSSGSGGGGSGGRVAWEVEVFMLETIAGWFEDYKARIMGTSPPLVCDEKKQQRQQQQQQEQEQQGQSVTMGEDELSLDILSDSFANSGASAPEVEAYWNA